MLDLSWHNILHSNLINFLILFAILYCVLKKPVKKAVDNTAENTQKSVQNSVDKKEKALANLDDTKADYAKTPSEIAEIKEIANSTLKSLEEKTERDIENAKKILEENSQKSVKSEEAKISSILTKETAEKSLTEATNDIKAKLSANESMQDFLIEQAIDELEKI